MPCAVPIPSVRCKRRIRQAGIMHKHTLSLPQGRPPHLALHLRHVTLQGAREPGGREEHILQLGQRGECACRKLECIIQRVAGQVQGELGGKERKGRREKGEAEPFFSDGDIKAVAAKLAARMPRSPRTTGFKGNEEENRGLVWGCLSDDDASPAAANASASFNITQCVPLPRMHMSACPAARPPTRLTSWEICCGNPGHCSPWPARFMRSRRPRASHKLPGVWHISSVQLWSASTAAGALRPQQHGVENSNQQTGVPSGQAGVAHLLLERERFLLQA